MFKVAEEEGLPRSLVFHFKWTLFFQTEGIPFGREGGSFGKFSCDILKHRATPFCEYTDLCSALKGAQDRGRDCSAPAASHPCGVQGAQ